MKTKLARSQTDRVISGVCSGLGAYLGIEAVWVRLFFVLMALADGFGVLAYLILWIVMPEAGRQEAAVGLVIESNVQEMAGRAQEAAHGIGEAVRNGSNRQAGIIFGSALIFLGVIFLLDNLHLFAWLSFGNLWPLVLILGGLALLISRVRGE